MKKNPRTSFPGRPLPYNIGDAMSYNPLQDSRLRETVEAVRPGSGDLADPAMGELVDRMAAEPQLEVLFRRLKRFDVRLAERLEDVPVPDGLARRIAERLAEESVEAGGAVAASAARPAPDAVPAAENAPTDTESTAGSGEAGTGRVSRRWLAAGIGLLAAAASLFAAAWIGYLSTPAITHEALLAAARERFLAEQRAFAEGEGPPSQAVVRASAPATRPPSSAVVRMRGMRWREAGEMLGRRAVAYDFPGREWPQATLYVLEAEAVKPLAMRPPRRPPSSTGGVSVAAWRQGDLLYVLAVRGGASTYRRLVSPPRRPLT
ncbi:MAG: hypothetical protein ACOC46_02725 [Pirellulales bacterium]